MRVGERVIPRIEDTRSLKECEEWAASTDSKKFIVDGVNGGIERVIGFAPVSVIYVSCVACQCLINGGKSMESNLLCALASDSDEYASSFSVRFRRVYRKIGASDNSELNARVHDES